MSINTLNLTLDIPCIQGKFNDRLVAFTTQIPPNSIINLLGHDPRSKHWNKLGDELKEIYKFLQRPTSKNRRDSIEGYIEERLGPNPITIGAFPSISIALNRSTPFSSFDKDGTVINKAVGKLHIDVSSTNMRILLDGLGRVTAALDLADSDQRELVENFLFPVTIYAPAPGTADLSWEEMGQLFHDFNFRVQPVTAQHALALDRSDIYISLANMVGKTPVIAAAGGVATRAASLGSKSSELVVQTVLVRMVRGACEGRAFQEANLSQVESPNLTKQTFGVIRDQLEDFLTRLAEKMGDRFAGKDQRKDSLLLTAPGWQALGIVFNDIYVKKLVPAGEREAAISKLAAVDWSRFNPTWIATGLGQPEIDKKTGQPVVNSQGQLRVALTGAGRNNTQAIIDFMRSTIGNAGKVVGVEVVEPEAAPTIQGDLIAV